MDEICAAVKAARPVSVKVSRKLALIMMKLKERRDWKE
jgi:hypothetical protein